MASRKPPISRTLNRTIVGSPPTRNRIARVAIVATFGALLFGYDTGVISGALPFMTFHCEAVTAFDESFIVSALLLGAAFGALIGGRMADKIGRRRLILWLAVVFLVGTLGCALAPNIPVMVVSRFVLGLAVGGASVTVPLYLSEVAPVARRGKLVTMNELMIVSGQLLAFIINAVLASAFPDHGAVWRYMLAVAGLPAVFLFFGMLRMPESPRWLILNGHPYDGMDVLKQVRDSHVEAEAEFDDIKAHAARTEALEKGSYADLKVRWIRRVLFIGLGIAMVQQLTGVNSVMYYGPQILEESGFTTQAALIGQTANGVISVLATFVGIWLLGRIGRRPMFIGGLIGTTSSLLLIGVFSQVIADGETVKPFIILLLTVTFLAFMQGTLGPLAWLMLSEIFPQRIRGLAFGLAALVLWLTNTAVGFAMPPLIESLGISTTFYIFAAIGLCSITFVAKFVPETRGRSLEALEDEFEVKYA
ncbi:sugar porter family MFS transporter [Micrococcales bacterium 31B]|nr:sugar porter family MFS transporter [Micrococcales bacterium 31B]